MKRERVENECSPYRMPVPRSTFLVFFVIPLPAIAVVGLFAAYDIYNATRVKVSETGSRVTQLLIHSPGQYCR